MQNIKNLNTLRTSNLSYNLQEITTHKNSKQEIKQSPLV
ncbi:hypothetical protein NC651_038230 [Populus alba x Populus x berolinensis]|nr:hypothetical protein NC651_038230 [Populus alba x Populus x berolinensis]